MKFAILVSVVVVAVAAQQQNPIFLTRSVQQVPLVPYPMTGIRPQQLRVLGRQQVPQTVYNPTQVTTPATERTNITEDSITETTTEPQSEQVQNKKDQRKENDRLIQDAQDAQPLEQGVYYLYHPSGVLQRVDYSTSNDANKMAYVAQLKYQNVDPISQPIYTYDPQTLLLQQLRV